MLNRLLHIRYYLEIVALPAFIFLVAHLSGHGIMLLLEGDHHHHGHHDHGHGHGHEGHGFDVHALVERFFTVEILSGVLMLVVFTWLWHRPALRKWVPCAHDHCHAELPTSHLLAVIAFAAHFFPEASVRHELFHGMLAGDTLSVVGVIGFGAHFFVDVIIALVLSSYWKTTRGFVLSLGAIVAAWVLAFSIADTVASSLPTAAEGILFLVSAFLLAMFVHKPHRPVKDCEGCES